MVHGELYNFMNFTIYKEPVLGLFKYWAMDGVLNFKVCFYGNLFIATSVFLFLHLCCQGTR